MTIAKEDLAQILKDFVRFLEAEPSTKTARSEQGPLNPQPTFGRTLRQQVLKAHPELGAMPCWDLRSVERLDRRSVQCTWGLHGREESTVSMVLDMPEAP